MPASTSSPTRLGVRLRRLVRSICAELEAEIIKGHMGYGRGPRPPVRVAPAARVGDLPDAEGRAEDAVGGRPPEQAVSGAKIRNSNYFEFQDIYVLCIA